MKLALSALVSWLAALLSVMAWLGASGEPVSRADLVGFGTMSLALCAVMIALVYLPGLFLIKRRLAGVRPAVIFPLVAGVALNVPAFLALAYLSDRTLVPEEARAFALAALLAGTTFGLGFVWSQRAGETPERA
ncbi:MAG TPA: hypothetical protein VF538_09430 [Pyrinomonadaceae bacterium]|jgi:hypothetical protein